MPAGSSRSARCRSPRCRHAWGRCSSPPWCTGRAGSGGSWATVRTRGWARSCSVLRCGGGTVTTPRPPGVTCGRWTGPLPPSTCTSGPDADASFPLAAGNSPSTREDRVDGLSWVGASVTPPRSEGRRRTRAALGRTTLRRAARGCLDALDRRGAVVADVLDALLRGLLDRLGRLLSGLLQSFGRLLGHRLRLVEERLGLVLGGGGELALLGAGGQEGADQPAGGQGHRTGGEGVATGLAASHVGHLLDAAGDLVGPVGPRGARVLGGAHDVVLESAGPAGRPLRGALGDAAGSDALGEDVDVLAQAASGAVDLRTDGIGVIGGGHRVSCPFSASGISLVVSTVRGASGVTRFIRVRPIAAMTPAAIAQSRPTISADQPRLSRASPSAHHTASERKMSARWA